MKDDKSGFKVVEVLGECRLRDDAGVEHAYWRRDGKCLAAGWYVVHWPAGAEVGRFHEEACFEGPFRERSGAEAGLQKILDLLRSEGEWDAGRRSPEEPIPVVDDRAPPRQRRST